MDEKSHDEAQQPAPSSRPRRWIGPAIYLTVILVPVLILIFSNTDSTRWEFAGFNGEAPLWIILVITFFAGAIVTRLLGWVWRTMRRHQASAS